MHLKRQRATTKLPIPRKGTKFVARALSNYDNSVPVVIALRDMLKLARTANEVKKMINQKILKINGRVVRDYRESISIFNILEAGKTYSLSLLNTGKFVLEEAKHKNMRLCKVIDKKILKNKVVQLNLHDGSNVISKENIAVGDSVYLDFEGKIKKHVSLQKGKEAFIISGKYIGLKGKIESIEGKKVNILVEKLDKSVNLEKEIIVAE
ncbi:MAG: KOW motif-containing protein [Nanoarchaeota archaeon]